MYIEPGPEGLLGFGLACEDERKGTGIEGSLKKEGEGRTFQKKSKISEDSKQHSPNIVERLSAWKRARGSWAVDTPQRQGWKMARGVDGKYSWEATSRPHIGAWTLLCVMAHEIGFY